ncbi:MAG: YihY/virulence factor BrkB family protein [Bacteroidales bacterium]|nr:YihY/virulence factor BrkB family protein [Candidatus Minthousia equi]
MKNMNRRMKKWRVDFHHYYHEDATIKNPYLRQLFNSFKKTILAVKLFINDKIMTRAQALTYSTLLAIVPLLALVFAVAKGFGFTNVVQTRLLSAFEGYEDTVQMVFKAVNSYLKHAHSGIFIGVGIVILLYSLISLSETIEEALNYIWQVKNSRKMIRKITDYLCLIFMLPILLIVLSGFSMYTQSLLKDIPKVVFLDSLAHFSITILPYLVAGLLLTCFYVFMPNTNVKFKNAIIPGLFAGTCFLLFQNFYLSSQIWVSQYNAIYGSLAALPLFLMWSQISWGIVLFGAELTFVNQNFHSIDDKYKRKKISRNDHDFVCMLILGKISQRSSKINNKQPYSADELAQELELPIRLINNLVSDLVRTNWIAPLELEKDDETRYLPLYDSQVITLSEMIKKFNREGKVRIKINRNKFASQWIKFCEAENAYDSVNSKTILKDLFKED